MWKIRILCFLLICTACVQVDASPVEDRSQYYESAFQDLTDYNSLSNSLLAKRSDTFKLRQILSQLNSPSRKRFSLLDKLRPQKRQRQCYWSAVTCY